MGETAGYRQPCSGQIPVRHHVREEEETNRQGRGNHLSFSTGLSIWSLINAVEKLVVYLWSGVVVSEPKMRPGGFERRLRRFAAR